MPIRRSNRNKGDVAHYSDAELDDERQRRRTRRGLNDQAEKDKEQEGSGADAMAVDTGSPDQTASEQLPSRATKVSVKQSKNESAGSMEGQRKCDMCVQQDFAVCRCKICDVFMCDECGKFHSRNKLTYLHPTETMEELKRERARASKGSSENEAEDSEDVVIMDDDSNVLDETCKIDAATSRTAISNKEDGKENQTQPCDVSASGDDQTSKVNPNSAKPADAIDECSSKQQQANAASSSGDDYYHDTEDDDLDLQRNERKSTRGKTLQKKGQKKSMSERNQQNKKKTDSERSNSSKVCFKCKIKNDAELLVCKGCDKVWHRTCAKVEETKTLSDSWRCEKCKPGKNGTNKMRRAVVESESESSANEESIGSSDSWSDAESTMMVAEKELSTTSGRVTRSEARKLGVGANNKAKDQSQGKQEDSSDSKQNKEENSRPIKRRRLRKPHQLSTDMIRAAEEGQKADQMRKEMREESAENVGAPLVLKACREGEEDVALPSCLYEELQAHQRVGVRFMWETTMREGKGCILAHCMGLGKTLQVICVLYAALVSKSEEGKKKTILILTPVNTLRNWEAEFRKWILPSMSLPVRVLMDAGCQNKARLAYIEEWMEEGGVMLIGYEQFRNLALGKNVRGKGSVKLKQRLAECLLKPGPWAVVCDEGHVLRNEDSGLSSTVRDISTLRRIVLTGTPLQNNLREYHCMVDFVRPGLLGESNAFKRDFVNPILHGQCIDAQPDEVKLMKKRSHILHSLLKCCVDRADFKVLAPFLSKKYEFVIAIRLSKLQSDLYQKYLSDVLSMESPETGGLSSKVRLFEAYHSLSKVWTNPKVLEMEKKAEEDDYDSMEDFIVWSDEESSSTESSSGGKPKKRSKSKRSRSSLSDEEQLIPDPVKSSSSKEDRNKLWWDDFRESVEQIEPEATGKFLFLKLLLNETCEMGDKVLVFSQSLGVLDLIEEMLKMAGERGEGLKNSKGVYRPWRKGRDYYRLDGSVGGNKRQSDIENFNATKKARLFLISTRAGSLGINLFSANRIVLMDASWNPSFDTQAIFRSYRLGQEKEVYVYRLLAHGTMEQKIYGRQITKQALASRVVDSEETGRLFTDNELKALLEFKPGSAGQGGQGRQGGRPGVEDLDENSPKQRKKLFDMSSLPPEDVVLARIMTEISPKWMVGYHEADSLVERDTELSKEEIEEAWEEWSNREKRAREEAERIQRANDEAARARRFQFELQRKIAESQRLLQQNQLQSGMIFNSQMPPRQQHFLNSVPSRPPPVEMVTSLYIVPPREQWILEHNGVKGPFIAILPQGYERTRIVRIDEKLRVGDKFSVTMPSRDAARGEEGEEEMVVWCCM
ncbi:hypothetical protein GUITHDRAFT_161847 [Guillardia theta CCMP2712]|uniref:Transcriptional regulator ATRX n=1 Tax=Guillardia theta (strain CCMP2712) TaxID=905079 RepID=L1JPW7_GUITC|nr:hypothetical protein GUITHDRAFT_161847 [Guillardia theta CCMP2712]EKX50636.1 hypothetical protein GUITHDRAFT_161847 [Guillardia theta CCMP2712]|eukprot:XP_005837616.1 hypothetical protein GUITHDRAFT_161847 [Guillardia theta CCMP2712]